VFSINDGVVLKPNIQEFHYRDDGQRFSLAPVMRRLQKQGSRGRVRRIDAQSDAVGVQFPGKREFLWFKPYEITKISSRNH
jgi:hypothetical protein